MKNKKKRFHLWPYLRPYKVPFIFAVITLVVENGLEISLPYLMNLMLNNGMIRNDDLTYSYNSSYLFTVGGIMVGMAIVAFFLGLTSSKLTAIAGRGLGYELRKEEYKKIQDFSFENLDSFRLNSLITRMTGDVQIISDTFCQIMRPLMRAPFQLIFALTFSFLISGDLAIVFAVAVPILAIFLITVLLVTRPKFYQLQGALDRINRTTDESLTAMRLIRANAKKDYEEEKFATVNTETKKVGQSALAVIASNQSIMQAVTYSCIIAILWLGSSQAISYNDADRLNDVASFLSYVVQTLTSLIMLSNVFMMLTRASASLERVGEVFVAENTIQDKKDSKLQLENGSIVFDHVNFKYNRNASEYVLKDINFEIKPGEFIGILGETGSSKSTLVYLIDRFYDAEEGKILIGGHDIKDYSLKELRAKIAINFQSPRLFTGTVKENLLWGKPDATDEEIIRACKIACCYDFIVHSLSQGFDTPISQGGNNVSGGQRQRLCLARAILRNPKILILDDSFSALDRITEATLKNNLRTMLPGMTKIVISQKVTSIDEADRIIVLNDGKISNIGDSRYLKEHDPIYQDIYRIQMEGL